MPVYVFTDYRRATNPETIDIPVDEGFKSFAVTVKVNGIDKRLTIDELTVLRQETLAQKRQLEAGEKSSPYVTRSVNDDIKRLDNNVRGYSELIGETRAQYVLKQQYKTVKRLESAYLDKRKNQQFDAIYLVTDTNGKQHLIQLEAKGGINPSSQYGDAKVGLSSEGVVESAQQGSRKYQENIWKHMKEKFDGYIKRPDYIDGTMPQKDRDIVEGLGESLQHKRLNSRQKYISIEQSLDSATGALGKTKLKYLTRG